jgi:hypothetical protein
VYGTMYAEKRTALLASVAGIALIAGSAAALGDSGARQTGRVEFLSREPGTATALIESAHYRDPDHPGGKPPAVRRIVVKYAKGFKIDTSVPERCTASDADLQASGSAACPPGSRVGKGGAEFATGFAPPADKFAVDFELFNARDEIIFLTKAHDTDTVVTVSRSTIDGRTLTSDVPPVPGGPPDGESSVKDIHFHLRRIAVRRDGERARYLRTPRTCPSSGEWTSHGTFTYADGVTQTLSPSTPCD